MCLIVSCFASAFAGLLGYSRIPFGAARAGHFFGVHRLWTWAKIAKVSYQGDKYHEVSFGKRLPGPSTETSRPSSSRRGVGISSPCA